MKACGHVCNTHHKDVVHKSVAALLRHWSSIFHDICKGSKIATLPRHDVLLAVACDEKRDDPVDKYVTLTFAAVCEATGRSNIEEEHIVFLPLKALTDGSDDLVEPPFANVKLTDHLDQCHAQTRPFLSPLNNTRLGKHLFELEDEYALMTVEQAAHACGSEGSGFIRTFVLEDELVPGRFD
eukprot:3428479-Pyramimonas_sp.AAC.1